MTKVSQEQVFTDLLTILEELSDDWEYSGEVTLETSFFEDPGLDPNDVAALGTAIQDRYRRPPPFAEYLAGIGQRENQDIQIGEVVEFIYQQLDGVSP